MLCSITTFHLYVTHLLRKFLPWFHADLYVIIYRIVCSNHDMQYINEVVLQYITQQY